jgi:SAM-dependent methyltransferase
MTSRPVFRTLMRLTAPLWKNRRIALWSESVFWSRWLRQHRDRVNELVDPARPFPADFARYVEHAHKDPIEVLEVGAGPFGAVGAAHPTRRIALTLTDVLAGQYDRLLTKQKIQRPVPVIHADAEHLVEQFGADAFDLVIATNCVDHMETPLVAIGEMLSVARTGACVVLLHEVDEAEHQDYAGLHQWNLNVDGAGHFVIWNQEKRHDLTQSLQESAEVTAYLRDEILYTEIRKKRSGVVTLSGE